MCQIMGQAEQVPYTTLSIFFNLIASQTNKIATLAHGICIILNRCKFSYLDTLSPRGMQCPDLF